MPSNTAFLPPPSFCPSEIESAKRRADTTSAAMETNLDDSCETNGEVERGATPYRMQPPEESDGTLVILSPAENVDSKCLSGHHKVHEKKNTATKTSSSFSNDSIFTENAIYPSSYAEEVAKEGQKAAKAYYDLFACYSKTVDAREEGKQEQEGEAEERPGEKVYREEMGQDRCPTTNEKKTTEKGRKEEAEVREGKTEAFSSNATHNVSTEPGKGVPPHRNGWNPVHTPSTVGEKPHPEGVFYSSSSPPLLEKEEVKKAKKDTDGGSSSGGGDNGEKEELLSSNRNKTSSLSSFSPTDRLGMKHRLYHTFFPPIVHKEHRKEILRTIIGAPPRRYSMWKWRTAKDFDTIQETHDDFLKSMADKREEIGLTSVAQTNAVAAYGDRLGGPNSPLHGTSASRRSVFLPSPTHPFVTSPSLPTSPPLPPPQPLLVPVKSSHTLSFPHVSDPSSSPFQGSLPSREKRKGEKNESENEEAPVHDTPTSRLGWRNEHPPFSFTGKEEVRHEAPLPTVSSPAMAVMQRMKRGGKDRTKVEDNADRVDGDNGTSESHPKDGASFFPDRRAENDLRGTARLGGESSRSDMEYENKVEQMQENEAHERRDGKRRMDPFVYDHYSGEKNGEMHADHRNLTEEEDKIPLRIRRKQHSSAGVNQGKTVLQSQQEQVEESSRIKRDFTALYETNTSYSAPSIMTLETEAVLQHMLVGSSSLPHFTVVGGTPMVTSSSGAAFKAMQGVEPGTFSYCFPTSQQGPQYFSSSAEVGEGEAERVNSRLVIVMVGLPARGKTFLAQKICRLLGWHGDRASVYNIQAAWRQAMSIFLAQQQQVHPETHKTDDEEKEMTKSGTHEKAGKVEGSEVFHMGFSSFASSPSSSCILEQPCSPASLGLNIWYPLRADHFYRLLTDPSSVERQQYLYVLDQFAADCRKFFEDSGKVIVLNDDFATWELRQEVEKRFKFLGSHFFYIEKKRKKEENETYNEFKVLDELEYPSSMIRREEARKDFAERLRILEEFYDPLDPRENLAQSCPCTTPPSPREDGEDRSQNSADPPLPRYLSSISVTTSAVMAPHHHRPLPESYIIIHDSSSIEVHGIQGYLSSRIVSNLMRISQRKMQNPIYFVRHGENCYNVEDRIGGDPLLTAQGMKDSAALLEFIASLQMHLEGIEDDNRKVGTSERHSKSQPAASHHNPGRKDEGEVRPAIPEEKGSQARNTLGVEATHPVLPFHVLHRGDGVPAPLPISHDTDGSCTESIHPITTAAPTAAVAVRAKSHARSSDCLEIWTSQLQCAIQAAELSERLLNIKTLRWSSLNEIRAGVCDGMTYAEIRSRYKQIDQFRRESKYTFRYPGRGESYQDLVLRLESVIMELENTEKVVVVVAHQAVLRCLLAYFGSVSAESTIHVKVPHRVVWRCTYDSKGKTKLDEMVLDNYTVGDNIRY